MKSPIPWIGGKSQLKNKIVEAFPPDKNYDRFIDVFGGGGSVLFAKDKHAALEVYNDANSNLVNFFRCLKYHRQELEREIRYYLNSREMFLDCREHIKESGFTDIQRAAMFYVLVKTGFGASLRTFGCNRKRLNTDSFEDIEKRLDGVVIENKDFEDLIKVYDRDKALFYCDPPYHKTERHYDVKFTNSDHQHLSDILHSIKGRFVLSYNDDEYIRSLYSDCNILAVSRNNSLSSSSFKEVVITNF
ncbi:DNA adenine methylase [Ruminococcus sp. Marseille-P6503]|uniref:DNA adenine methylase n=1 Tax=Ruminococcus sp. Marseille-P6503 TaxID=2364796 RepID=UPI000F537EBF|nr:DNA adenine methylase [Ruminococcus sp. Marseille-P6503]